MGRPMARYAPPAFAGAAGLLPAVEIVMNDSGDAEWASWPEDASDPGVMPNGSGSDPLRIGLDIGSTTVKLVACGGTADGRGMRPVFARYRRHNSCGWKTAAALLREFAGEASGRRCGGFSITVTGSGGIAVAERLGLPFVQEVAAAGEAVSLLEPAADVVIELGGEDAKILFLTGGAEQRMNETCAGGTGAFIDRMAAFLNTDAEGLDRLAEGASTLYPIASRCGVFAKADILPLLNEGASRSDIAASIFQAVVDQTVSGLACGRRIGGRVVFLGGPLAFLPQLRRRFAETLRLAEGMDVLPEGAPFFVALGAALLSPAFRGTAESGSLPEALEHAASALDGFTPPDGAGTLPPLFRSREEYEDFRARHASASAERAMIGGIGDGSGSVPVWFGVDAGSTTIKSVLVDGQGRILHETYGPSRGGTLEQAVSVLRAAYGAMPPGVHIAGACVTGYGAALLRAAFRFDADEVETVAHARAACAFEPDASFVLDIGGQDMKCLRLQNGTIIDLQLNEACSSGCGSFIETFARSLGMELDEFMENALFTEEPVDLGTRCTVFMNSRVKQAQKEGRTASDIAAGLSYSVIRNALYKVIRIGSTEELGDRIVVQGGAFRNDALLRALELMTGRTVVRPDIAGLMGAYGAALLARDASLRGRPAGGIAKSSLAGPEELAVFAAESRTKRCPGCANRCLLTVSRFGKEGVFVSGNRCERGEALAAAESGAGGARSAARNAASASDLAAEKYARLFEPYRPLPIEAAPRGELGIPRALNMYESYPFWFTLLTRLGFRVVLSPPSGKRLFSAGMDTIPSQTVCYPAKLCHGHIAMLLRMGVRRIFFPCILFEGREFPEQDNRFSCPVVTGYPELLRNNVDMLKEQGAALLSPVISMDDGVIRRELSHLDGFGGIPDGDWEDALAAAHAEQQAFRSALKSRAVEILAGLARSGGKAIVLAGHPYHVDPEIGRGISALIAAEGIAVLTEDAVAGLADQPARLRVVNQWTYHSRLYRAAAAVLLSGTPVAEDSPLRSLAGEDARWPSMALLQIVSFGCGLDTVTADQVHDILADAGLPSSRIKLDEGANMGAARIRIRSLAATLRAAGGRFGADSGMSGQAMEASSAEGWPRQGGGVMNPGRMDGRPAEEGAAGIRRGSAAVGSAWNPPAFTEEMKATHTILIPQMAPFQFRFLPAMLRGCGYRAELLPSVSADARETGLRFVNNDVCFPAVTVIGQLLEEVRSGRRRGENVALIISQTGGACRATNYISFLRRAMESAGLTDIPLLSFNYAGMSRNPGFRIDAGMTVRGLMALLCGDLLMKLVLGTRPYELEAGAAERLAEHWAEAFEKDVFDCSPLRMWRHAASAVKAFDLLPLAEDAGRRPRVGLVGEILLKYHPDANNNAVGVIESEGGEAVVSGMADFVMYALLNDAYRTERFGGGLRRAAACRALMGFVRLMQAPFAWALRRSRRFEAPASFSRLRRVVRGIVSEGQQAGEGWLLTAEMAELLESGVESILCLQPFGCLPNHITGKGVIRELRRRYPGASIAAVDYDAGLSEVNQLNRIRLMMAYAGKRAGKSEPPKA
ncbi:MAG: acyl-CoA dehydratase activase-related protein [Mailhella sp.]|nr:acyl-CoA dehydratase activase-related protein [Mailhella sp.]